MKLLVAIPALNEEASIASTIERTLAAQDRIIRSSPVEEVEVTVVSDGSTDRTVALARCYEDQITLIVFPKNRGYGAAIKEAWKQSDADLVGFMDADGTCDPLFFSELCTALEQEKADIALGCRMNYESEMPLVRKIGNTLYAWMITFLSSTRVRDVASGMRVIRRSSLPKIMPLPDGLHFTPAMSARASLSHDLSITEIDMPYHEREGESKLSVWKDGFRFLLIILKTAFLYRPSRPLAFVGLSFLLIAFGLMVTPLLYYMQHGIVLEWMIYRFVVSDLLATGGLLLLCVSYLSRKIVTMTLLNRTTIQKSKDVASTFFSGYYFWMVPVLLTAIGGALVFSSFVERIITGDTYEHWSRFIAMSFFLSSAIILIITRVLDYSLDLISERLAYLREQQLN